MTTRKTYTHEQLIELFDEDLNAQGEVNLAGVKYLPSELLLRIDELHYDLAFDAWKDNMGYREVDSDDNIVYEYYNINDTTQTEGEQS